MIEGREPFHRQTSTGSVTKNRVETMIEERDISVAMRDGTRLAVDVYRPDAAGKYPVLYASALHNKDIQGPDIADILPPQPAHAPLWLVGRTLRSRGHRPLRPDRMDHAAAMVKRQGRDGRHLRLCRRAMARCRAGASRTESYLSLRRVQRVWRHVRIP